VCAGFVAGILAASVFGTSPGEAAAQRAVPLLPPPVATVARQTLTDEVRVPCEPGSASVPVGLPRLAAGQPAVVTRIGVKPGAAVQTGDLLAVVSGVPLIAVVTPLPFYRDLGPGDAGPDVEALERALVHVHRLKAADASFDSGTAAALDAVYKQAGLASSDQTGRLRLNSSVSVGAAATVEQVAAGVGQILPPGSVLMTLATAGRTLRCPVPLGVPVSVGQTLELHPGDGGRVRSLVVRSLGEPDRTSSRRPMVLAPAETGAAVTELPVRGDVVLPATAGGGPVLAVPVGALWTSPDGQFSLRRVQGPDDDVQILPVTVGRVAGGYAEVSGTGLAEGLIVQLHLPDRGVTTLPSGAPPSGAPRSDPLPSGALRSTQAS
jgi:hypothetical protein